MNARDYLIALAVNFEGDWHKIYDFISKKEELPEEDIKRCLGYLKCNALTILDPEYPDYLRQTFCAPFVLFYYGDISLIFNRDNNVAVVGGRNASKQGRENIDYIVSGISKRYTIVSGLAKGLDSVAHRSALDSGGRTIAVLANGIDYCYPYENTDLYETIKKNNLVISEYFNFLSPASNHFHQRNRLIVAFSKATIIGEAKKRSGTLITANLTLQAHNDLMTIPTGDIHDSLNNILIREGCPVILTPEDVFEWLGDKENSLLGEVK